MRYLTSVQKEGNILGHGVDMVIVLELHKREEIVPIILLLINEKPEKLFQLLINLFCLSVSLRMVCHSLAADRVVTVLTKWLHLVTESTMTIIASFPFDSGSCTIKSMLAVSQGVSGIGSGCNSLVSG